MKIALQFAMPSELHALPGARELAPLETVSGVPIFEIAPDILACAGGVSKVNAAMAAELLCLRFSRPDTQMPASQSSAEVQRRGKHSEVFSLFSSFVSFIFSRGP